MTPEVTGVPTIRHVPRPDTPMRSVPLLSEPRLGHYPEFRDLLAECFKLSEDPFAAPPVLEIAGRHYELVFVGFSGQPFPAALEVNALVPGLEPLDEAAADAALSVLSMWLVSGASGIWKTEDLRKVGQIYKIPVFADAEESCCFISDRANQ